MVNYKMSPGLHLSLQWVHTVSKYCTPLCVVVFYTRGKTYPYTVIEKNTLEIKRC